MKALLGAVLLITVTACGGSDKPAAKPESTPEPMSLGAFCIRVTSGDEPLGLLVRYVTGEFTDTATPSDGELDAALEDLDSLVDRSPDEVRPDLVATLAAVRDIRDGATDSTAFKSASLNLTSACQTIG